MIVASVQGLSLKDGYYSWNGALYVGVRVFGHSGLAKKGEDIVCAAVSVLVQAASKSLAAKSIVQSVLRDEGQMAVLLEWESMKDGERRAAVAAFDMMIHGFLAVAESYPENLSITFE